jgi:parvulin-like peptidyl-prolyl isomerase
LDELAKRRAGRTESEFRDIVDQQGLTLDELKKTIENQYLESLFWYTQVDTRFSRAPKQRPTRTIDPRPDEVRAYYTANLDQFRRPERARVSVIMVRASKVGSREAAVAIAAELREKILAGADFADLARAHSSYRAEEGGDLGWFGRDAGFLEAIKDFAFAQPPGTLSDVIPSGDVALLLRQDGYEPESVQPFEEVSRAIFERLRKRKGDALYIGILSELIRDAFIYPPILKERLEQSVQESSK